MFERRARELRARLLGNHDTTTVDTATPQHTAKPRPENRPRPHPQALASEISHVIRLLDTSTTATNVAIPTSRFQYLKDVRGNYVRDCWETMTLTSFSRSQSRGTACEIVGKPRHNDRRHRSPPTHSEAATGKPGHGLVDGCGSDEEGQLLHQAQALPPPPQPQCVARARQRNENQDERVDQVLVNDRVQ